MEQLRQQKEWETFAEALTALRVARTHLAHQLSWNVLDVLPRSVVVPNFLVRWWRGPAALEGTERTAERDEAMLRQWYEAEEALLVAFRRTARLWHELDSKAVEEKLLEAAGY